MEENMRRAQHRDAVTLGKFFFRKSVVPEDTGEEGEGEESGATQPTSHDQEYTLMSIDTILNGKVN